jgi:hypothetical protein
MSERGLGIASTEDDRTITVGKEKDVSTSAQLTVIAVACTRLTH